jgi:hypothetical protein
MDKLTSAELVTADGQIIVASAQLRPDLFWALRGAGSAGFGVVTMLEFKTQDVPQAYTYNYEATVSQGAAERFLMKWQDWVDKAPKDMSSVVFLRKQPQTRLFFVQVRGLTISQNRLVRRELTRVTRELNPRARPVLQKRSFLQTFEWFSGEEDFSPTYEKGKSDIVKTIWNSR